MYDQQVANMGRSLMEANHQLQKADEEIVQLRGRAEAAEANAYRMAKQLSETEIALNTLQCESVDLRSRIEVALTALVEIRDHSLAFDVDEIPCIAREALGQIDVKQAGPSDAELFRKLEFLAHNGPVSEWDQIYRAARQGKLKEYIGGLPGKL